jgi:hypothetical protein
MKRMQKLIYSILMCHCLQLFSRLKREEAKISAWENLQKAKAEAAIRKLEVIFLMNCFVMHCYIYVETVAQ